MSRHERIGQAVKLATNVASDAASATGEGPVPDIPQSQVSADARAPGRKALAFGLVGLAVLAGAGWKGHDYWTEGRFLIETEDAYVQADITLVSSRVQGYVAQVLVNANERVNAGDVLVRLDDGDYRIALETARSRVATGGDTLVRIDAQIEAARAAVVQAEAVRDAAEAQLRTATTNSERIRRLADQGVAPQAQLDEASEVLDTATAGVAQARAAVTSAEAQVDVLVAQRAEAEGARRELQLAVEQAQRNLDLTVLRAPAAGTVANLTLEVGDLVTSGSRLAALVPDDGLYIEANYKETQMPGIVPGETVHVTFDALPDQEFEGIVASTSPATGSVFSLLPADNATGNFTKVVQRVPVRIDLPAEALATGQLRAGLSAIVAVDRRTAPDGVLTARSTSE
ncbi:HlyD family secretion protein [Rubellimicrobium rubrum]|uniref:HlyD family secretion protein n=1 Tax=Rubellimicrobium rubrum TaxID=2585369 RepID=A0A5C4MWC4_9RHOB|nr:HlyD family secretion protein [Rubellimicrobium rubrum]TNC50416.1 HlyD family secretion protein [Rubellimicrobium rubrum]